MSHHVGVSQLDEQLLNAQSDEQRISARHSLSRPGRKSLASKRELSSNSLMADQPSAAVPVVAVQGLKAFYASERKHIWFTIMTILVLVSGFVVFERLYPQTRAAAVPEPGPVPFECTKPDSRGCFDFDACIKPSFIDKPAHLQMPTCTASRNPCNYRCICVETMPSQLTENDFAIPRFLFFSPRVPLAQAGLGGAFLLSFGVTVLLRRQRGTQEAQCVIIQRFYQNCIDKHVGTLPDQARTNTKNGSYTPSQRSAQYRVSA